jgi:hypothetical protein
MQGIDHIKEVCKIGKRELCCRYLLMAPTGWECGKLDSRTKTTLDNKVKYSPGWTAKGDNCEGKTKEFLNHE